MEITFYDVTLRTIEESDKELIRYWRNHEKIKSKMEFRSYITREMHNQWFAQMSDYKNAFAFIIEYNNTSVGVVFNKNSKDHSNGGMFIWDEVCLNTQVPVLVSIMLTDLNFYWVKNRCAYINIVQDNKKSQEFNKWLGYKLVDTNDANYNQLYVLTELEYKLRSDKIRFMLNSYYNCQSQICFVFHSDDIATGMYQYCKLLMDDMDETNKNKIAYYLV
jgi:RimJ/RimL family protein N-acetyltransferase